MRIIFLTANPFPAYSGGMETWLYNVIRVMQCTDSADIVVVSPNSYEKPFFDLSGFTRLSLVQTSPTNGSQGVAKVIERLPGLARLIASNYQSVRWMMQSFAVLRRTAAKDDVIVVVHSVPGMLPAALLKLVRHPSRVVCSVRGRVGLDLELAGHPRIARFYKGLERFLLRYADALHSNGQDTADYLLNDLGLRSVVLANGVNYDRFASPPADVGDNRVLQEMKAERRAGIRLVATVATLRDVKGIRYMIEAATYLKSAYADSVRFVFIGKGDPSRYREYASELGVADMMFFTGEQKNVSGFLREVDICVAVSGGGGVSNAAIEMMAAGRPIVAWDNSTYYQLLEHNSTGILVKERDSHALAEGIEFLLSNPDTAAHLAANAQAASRQYDWREIVPRFLEIARGQCARGVD